MTKQFESHGVEAEKAEAMRRYNNQKRFRTIIRAVAVAFFCYLWFPTVAVSLQPACGWFYRTGTVMLTNRTFVFFFTNILVALIVLHSRGHDGESSSNEPDLYDQYTSSSFSTVTVTASDEKVVDGDDFKKQIVEVHEEVVVTDKQIVPVEEVVVEIRRTKSERKKKKVDTPVKEFRRTESANSGIERLSSEEFRLKVEAFIMEKKKNLVQEENDVVEGQQRGSSSGLELVGC